MIIMAEGTEDMEVTETTMVETMGMKHMTRTTLTRVLHQEQQEAEVKSELAVTYAACFVDSVDLV